MSAPILPSSGIALRRVNPINLTILLLIVFLPAIAVIGKFNSEIGIEWSCVMIGILFYTWISAILAFFSRNFWKFLGTALLCYVLLILAFFFTASYFSGTRFYEIYTYSQFFKAVNIFYSVGLFVAFILRSMVSFLEAN